MIQTISPVHKLVLVLCIGGTLAGCTSTRLPEPAATQGPSASSHEDPYAYCSAVGTTDTPDERYIGEPLPDSVIQSMIDQGIVSAEAPQEFQRHAVWRCMDSNVWVCHFGANLPCLEKADTSQSPTSAMEEFCTANPTADSIPAVVTGRATAYAWRCADGKPEVLQQIFSADPQGYLADFWYELSPD